MTSLSSTPATALVFIHGYGWAALGPAIGEGAEGSVHALGDGRSVVKLYRPDRVTPGVVAKLERMIATPVADARLAWPLALVADNLGRVVGYAMPHAHGRTLQKSVFVPTLLREHLPRWTRLQLVELSIALVRAMETLHRHAVLVGDVNGGNIVVAEEPNAVRLVDLDSCQIGDFRSPVGTVPFLAPRLLGVRLDSVSRTFDDECFAIATLIFMILVPGKPPYSRQGGGDPAENIRAAKFPYAAGANAAAAVPLGPWGNIWSHLPRVLRALFQRAFSHHQTVGPAEWRAALEDYRYRLLTGQAALDVFPATPRHEAPAVPAPAARTASSPPRVVSLGPTRTIPGIQPSDVAAFRSCIDCHSTFVIDTVEEDRFRARGLSLPRRCEHCREELRNAPSTFHTCKDCFAQFEVTAREARTFASKALSLPRRCKSCRAARRTA